MHRDRGQVMFRAGRALPYWALEGVTVARHILDSFSAHIISHARQKGRCEDACPARLPAAARTVGAMNMRGRMPYCLNFTETLWGLTRVSQSDSESPSYCMK